MNKIEKSIILIILNFPILIAILSYFNLLMTTITIQASFVFYYFSLSIIFLYCMIKVTNLSSTFDKLIKNDFLKKLLKIIDKFLPAGFLGTVFLIPVFLYNFLLTCVEKYFNNLFLNYLKEIGTKISAIEEKIIFEPISLIGFDFATPKYFVIFLFNFTFLHPMFFYFVILCLFILLITKENILNIRSSIILFIIILNLFTYFFSTNHFYIGYTLNNNKLLLEEIGKTKNHQLVVKYPFFSEILKEKEYVVSIQNKDVIITKQKLGLVSFYIDENINIIHPDSVFCSLRNYNNYISPKASLFFYDLITDFKNNNKSLSVQVGLKNNLDNIYDLSITNQYNTILIENTYLEYDGTLLYFKKLEQQSNNIEVYISCENSMYSLYYGKNKVGIEPLESKLTTLEAFFAKSAPTISPQDYTFRGRNINYLNPYQCDQLKFFEFKKNEYILYDKKIKRSKNSLCITQNSVDEETIEELYNKSIYIDK